MAASSRWYRLDVVDDAILILGIAQRSGTNYLAQVLQCHPDCALPAPPVLEDHLLRDAGHLVEYARRAAGRWAPEWGDTGATRAELEHHLGQALTGFLQARAGGRRVVSKTPSLEGIELLARLIPDARLVVLVRDGRSVAASLMQGFHLSADQAIRNWRAGARALRRFEREGGRAPLVVRYESLLDHFEGEVRRVLDHCGLDPATFDFEAAASLPVKGSSFDRPDHGKLTWDPVTRSPDFDAAGRHRSWPAATNARFDWLAGREQAELGYPRPDVRGGRAPWLAYNLVLDACWPARAAARRAFDRGWLRLLRARRSWRSP
jgi:hypothetical protein